MNIHGAVVVKPFKDDRWISGTIRSVDDYIEVFWSNGITEKFQKETTQLLVYDIGPTGTSFIYLPNNVAICYLMISTFFNSFFKLILQIVNFFVFFFFNFWYSLKLYQT